MKNSGSFAVAFGALMMLIARPVMCAQGTAGAVLAGNHSASASRPFAAEASFERRIEMRAFLKLRNRDQLDSLLRSQQDPASPMYHRWLRTGEFEERFAPTSGQYETVGKWLESSGFSVIGIDRRTRSIRFSGTIGEAERAFKVRIKSFANGFYGNVDDPSIPSSIAESIGFIDGLDNTRAMVSRPMSLRTANAAVSGHARSGSGGSAAPNTILDGERCFGPADMYSFYDETPLLEAGINGQGECIGLIEAGDFLDESLAAFDSTFNLPAPAITRTLVNGVNPGITFRSGETIFDVQWAHAMAPGAPINVYIASPLLNGDNVIFATVSALIRAVSDNTCSTLSISIESCGLPPLYYTEVRDPVYAQAAAQGQTVFVAVGDEGAAEFDFDPVTGACPTGTSRHVNELAADPNITSIGGTQFQPNYDSQGNNVGFVPESAWNEQQFTSSGIGSTGGGTSSVFSKPYYQNGVTPNDGARDVPDISMEAACANPSVASTEPRSTRVECGFCGTSLGAPVWAGITQLLIQKRGHRVGTLNPTLYRIAGQRNAGRKGIRDVTLGNNDFNGVVGFDATEGYDLTTGWGTPDIAEFIASYLNPPPAGRISAPAKVGFGKVRTGRMAKASLNIRNKGKGMLHVTVGAVDPPFYALGGNGSVAIDPGRSAAVKFAFIPSAAGEFRQTVSIVSDDPANPALDVGLTGKAK